MIELSVFLLSGLRVTRDGEERLLTSRRQRAMLAALALRPGRSIGVDQLIDALWGEEPPASARATLQTYVSRLRAVVGDDAVLHGPDGYRLADGATCDAEVARELAAQARDTMATAPDRAAAAAREALDLWDGPALAELAHDPWFLPVATGFEELRANLVDLAAEGLVASGRPGEAVELLEPATRADPLREPSHVLLIDALRSSGRAVEALRVAERFRRRLRDETGLDPGPALVAAEQRALSIGAAHEAGSAGDPVTPPAGAVLPRPSQLVGRAAELAEVLAALGSARLVTIGGPGGVGKTRLAAEVAARLAPATRTVVVELAPVGPGEVAAGVAAALQLRGDRPSLLTISEHLRDAADVVILDNAEHVIEEVRELIRTVIDRCPAVRVVVTSRSRVDGPEEHLVTLAPLATDGEQPAAVELFLSRLAQLGRTASVAPEEGDVRHICARLDGLPLALELAAGRAAVLGVEGLRDRLDGALDLIAIDHDGHRHGSLRHIVAWSYDLLDDSSRQLLMALAAFEGEFDLEAAEHVGTAVLGRPVSLLVGRLIDASLVATTGVPGRYRLLEMIRQFGRDRMAADGRVAVVRHAHARWVGERLAEIDAGAVGPGEADTSHRLDGLRDDIRSALRSARSDRDVDLATTIIVPLAGPLLYRPDAELVASAGSLVRHLVDSSTEDGELPDALLASGARLAFLAGDLQDVDRLAELALHRAGAGTGAPARHRAHHARGVVRLYQGRHAEAAAAFADVTEDGEASVVDRLDALGGLGLALSYDGRTIAARDAVAQHRAMADTVGSDTYLAFAAYMQGELDLAEGDVDAALVHLREAADRAWLVGAAFIWGISATVLAAVLVRHRPPEEARAHLPVLLERWRRTATWTQLWSTLRLLAELLAAHDRPEVAALILYAADRDPAAPQLAGDDVERDAALRRLLHDRLGDSTLGGIAAGAEALARLDVLHRAVAALEQLDSTGAH